MLAAGGKAPGWEKAFALKDRTLRCVDEGTSGGLHSAGSGIYFGLEEAVRRVRAAGVDGITSHENCGATLAWCGQNGMDAGEAEKVAQEWARKLAQAAGVAYRGYLSYGEMLRKDEFHYAVAVYYDGTGRFNPAAAPDLPAGFTVSRRYFDPHDLELCLGIALGEYGFGERFTQSEPLYAVVIGDEREPQFSADRLAAELEPRLKKFNGRVAIARFPLPVFDRS